MRRLRLTQSLWPSSILLNFYVVQNQCFNPKYKRIKCEMHLRKNNLGYEIDVTTNKHPDWVDNDCKLIIIVVLIVNQFGSWISFFKWDCHKIVYIKRDVSALICSLPLPIPRIHLIKASWMSWDTEEASQVNPLEATTNLRMHRLWPNNTKAKWPE